MLGLAVILGLVSVWLGCIGTTKFLHSLHIPAVTRLGRLGRLLSTVLVLAVLLHGLTLSVFWWRCQGS